MKHVTILENDQLHEHRQLSDVLECFKTSTDAETTIWEWFAQDVIQNKEACIKRLHDLSKDEDHVFLTYPSFIGYDNTFNGWLWYLNQLSRMEIKLKLYIVFGSNANEGLDAFCLRYYFNQKGHSDCDVNRQELIDVLKNHDIYFTSYSNSMKAYYSKQDMWSTFKPLTWDVLYNQMYDKGDVVRIIETGEEKKVIYSFYWKELDGCYFDLIMDEELHQLNENNKGDREKYRQDAYKSFKLHEIEKIQS